MKAVLKEQDYETFNLYFIDEETGEELFNYCGLTEMPFVKRDYLGNKYIEVRFPISSFETTDTQ